jgi:hypothetical protein
LIFEGNKIMQINFGKHVGKKTEEVVLKHASYVEWVMSEPRANPQFAAVQSDVRCLIKILDAKPFFGKCSSIGCGHAVTKLTAYIDNYEDLYGWCDYCDPYSSGANTGKLSEVSTYADIIKHVRLRCGATKGGYDRIVKEYAKWKGLPSRVSASTAVQFFA